MSDISSKRVLILEDDEFLLSCLDRLVRDLGFDSLGFKNVKEAQEAITEHEFYAAILDNSVPAFKSGSVLTGEGLRYGRQLRETHPQIKIALHTLDSYDKYGIEYLQSLGIAYIGKMEMDQIKDFLREE